MGRGKSVIRIYGLKEVCSIKNNEKEVCSIKNNDLTRNFKIWNDYFVLLCSLAPGPK